jgi:hypothetical protein
MHGISLNRASERKNTVLDGTTAIAIITARVATEPIRKIDARDLRRFDGQRAGLIEEHMRDLTEIFQHILRFDQDAGFRQTPGSSHICHGRRDEQRAGSRQNQDLRESRGIAGH